MFVVIGIAFFIRGKQEDTKCGEQENKKDELKKMMENKAFNLGMTKQTVKAICDRFEIYYEDSTTIQYIFKYKRYSDRKTIGVIDEITVHNILDVYEFRFKNNKYHNEYELYDYGFLYGSNFISMAKNY